MKVNYLENVQMLGAGVMCRIYILVSLCSRICPAVSLWWLPVLPVKFDGV
jgi:hypothetical protein